MTMERFVKSRLFTFFVYFFLITLILYMLLLIKPILVSIFSFLKAVLAPFLLALIISYVLNPIVNVLERRKVPRTVAVLLIYTVFITSLTVIFMNVSPVFIRQLKEMDEYLPELTKKAQSIIDRIYDNESLPEAVRIGIYDLARNRRYGFGMDLPFRTIDRRKIEFAFDRCDRPLSCVLYDERLQTD